jgi:hypothetical protein
MSSFFLNINSPAWDPVTPVTLPVGALNSTTFVNASYGVFMPCVIFMIAAFVHVHFKLIDDASKTAVPGEAC